MNLRHLIAFILLASSAFAEPAVFVSKKAPADVTLTADPESRFWRDVPNIVVTADYAGKPVPNRMEARSRWTSDNLYILFICDFDELTLKPNPTCAPQILYPRLTQRLFRANIHGEVRRRRQRSEPHGPQEYDGDSRSPARADVMAQVFLAQGSCAASRG